MNPVSDKTWRVGASLIAGLLLVTVPHRASGQHGPAESTSNIVCLEYLEVPNYPPLARQGRFQAIQTVKVLLSGEATVQSIEYSVQGKTVNAGRIFREGVEKALKNSRFSRTCAGETITLVFHYEVLADESNSSLFAFGPPNHFWIRAGPVLVNPEVSVK